MDFLSGFKWALPAAFSDAAFLCSFEEGDIIYDTPLAYEGKWSSVRNKIQYFVQIKYPERGYSPVSTECGIFETNWFSEVRLELYKNHKRVTIGEIRTTQGKLYSTLWKGDLTYILNEDAKTPEPPINVQGVTKNLGKTSAIVRKLTKGQPTFVMVKDDTNPIAREKYLKIKKALSVYLQGVPIIMSPNEAGISNAENIIPTIQVIVFVTKDISSEELEKVVKSTLYTPSKNATTDRFRVSAHGRIFPDDSELLFIYQDAKGNISKRDIFVISQSNDYLQGVCRESNGIRTFRKDRVLEHITDISIIEERLDYFIKENPTPSTSNTTSYDICFTGFKKQDKEKLQELARQKSMNVRSSVTKNLAFLCCGYNAGAKKIEAARKQGVIVFNENQFRAMLETGELPEE